MKARSDFGSLHEEAVYLLRLTGQVIKHHHEKQGTESALCKAVDEFFAEYDKDLPIPTPAKEETIEDLL